MTYTKEIMPWKIKLRSRRFGKEYTFYRSITDFLSYMDEAWEVEIFEKNN